MAGCADSLKQFRFHKVFLPPPQNPECRSSKRVLALSNCELDSTLGSGKTRLRWTKGLEAAGFTVHSLTPDELMRSIPKAFGVRFRLAFGAWCHVALSDCDLLECFGAEFGLLSKHWFRRRSRPLIVSHTDGLELLNHHLQSGLQGGGVKRSLTRSLHRGLDWMAFRNADALVAGCEADVRFAREHGLFSEETAVCINPGVDPEYLDIPFRTERDQLVVYFGTWSARKAPERIVRVMTEVLERDLACRFEVLGASGAEQAIIHAFPVELRARVEVHPKLPTREVAAILLRSKVMFFPSHYEGFGMAISEAMACGCTVVVTPTGFGADLRDGQDGFVRDFTDEAGMRENILNLLRADELRISLARAGWERVQKLSWGNQCLQLSKIYSRWLAAWDYKQGRFRENAFHR